MAAVLFLALCFGQSAATITLDLSPSGLRKFLGSDDAIPDIESGRTIPAFRNALIASTRRWAKEQQNEMMMRGHKPAAPSEYPYFAFIPPFRANLVPGGPEVSWSW